MSAVRAARIAVAAVIPGELALMVCLVAGVRPPGWVLAAAEALVCAVLLLEARVLYSLYAASRAGGAAPARPAARHCGPWCPCPYAGSCCTSCARAPRWAGGRCGGGRTGCVQRTTRPRTPGRRRP